MPPKKQDTPEKPAVPQWTPEQLLAVRHLGPSIIGAEMHAASQAFDQQTAGGKFGPALR